jgi:hypothetical protein
MKTFINQSIAARTYTAIETFHTETEREDRIKELKETDNDMTFKRKVAFDVQDAFLLEYTICMNS